MNATLHPYPIAAPAPHAWKVVHEWTDQQPNNGWSLERFAVPIGDHATEAAARAHVAARVAEGMQAGEGYFIRDPDGTVIHRTYATKSTRPRM